VIRADELVAAAIRETGLEDFGTDSFREGLEIYCESVSAEAQLNEIGGIAVSANITGNLVNRLRVVDWSVQHPAVAAERIERPLFVIGMFRAGTTLLSNLLDQDPSNRALLRWEAGDSVPPVDPASLRAGPRVDAAQASGEVLEQLNPKIAVVHHEEASGPTECITVMSQDFKSLAWEAITNVPTYGRWLCNADHGSAYEYHRMVLQVLQSGGSRGRWTLKSPHHAIALDDLTEVYPDARLVLLHRDPVVLCASVCSLIQTLSSTFSDADHGEYIARHWTRMLETSVERTDAFRVDRPAHPILDVQYADLVRSPVETVARIYGAFGDELSEEAEADIAEYVSLNRKGQFGEHRYDLAEFGLDEAELAERFAPYVSRYEIPAER
jgi:hypothetical protein